MYGIFLSLIHICVAMPLKVHELLASVDAAVEESELRKKKARQQPKQRNVFDKQQIMLAKDLLMKQKGMTEEEAHRYLQKSSMANGVNMIETAQMVLSILGKDVYKRQGLYCMVIRQSLTINQRSKNICKGYAY